MQEFTLIFRMDILNKSVQPTQGTHGNLCTKLDEIDKLHFCQRAISFWQKSFFTMNC